MSADLRDASALSALSALSEVQEEDQGPSAFHNDLEPNVAGDAVPRGAPNVQAPKLIPTGRVPGAEVPAEVPAGVPAGDQEPPAWAGADIPEPQRVPQRIQMPSTIFLDCSYSPPWGS